jgi:hypothetical protein
MRNVEAVAVEDRLFFAQDNVDVETLIWTSKEDVSFTRSRF